MFGMRTTLLAVLGVMAPLRSVDDRPLLERCRVDRAPVSVARLPAALAEISGLAVTEDGRVLAHDDERALVHEVDPANGRILKTFGLAGGTLRADFEGLAAAHGRIWLITSDGILFEAEEGGDGRTVPFRSVDTGLGGRCEIEGLTWEPKGGILLMACKTPRQRRLEDQVTVFRWVQASRALASDPMLVIPYKGIQGTKQFRASGIDRDPATGNYLLVSGVDQHMIEVSSDGRVVASVALKNRQHPQAEGIAVLPGGRLLISDESQSRGRGGRLTLYACR